MERPPLFDDELRLSYAKYYFIDPDPLALQAIREPMDEADVLPPDRISEMLAPGYQDVMMGYHIKEGMSYSSFYARLPGVTTEMLDWWFCWMALRPPTVDPSHGNLRYKIWNPAVHFDQAPPRGGLPTPTVKHVRDDLLHNLVEMPHLAKFLPRLYAEEGDKPIGAY